VLFFVFRKFPIGSKQNLQEEDMQPLYKGQRACPQRVLCSEVLLYNILNIQYLHLLKLYISGYSWSWGISHSHSCNNLGSEQTW